MPDNNTLKYTQKASQSVAGDFGHATGSPTEQSIAKLECDTALLRRWTESLTSQSNSSKPLSAMAQLRAENESLRNEILHLQTQWDGLRTTLGVLSTTVSSREIV